MHAFCFASAIILLIPDRTLTHVRDPLSAPAHAITPQAASNSATVPGYDVFEEVGRGGIVIVYRARDGNPEYWIVKLIDRQIEVRSDPYPASRTDRAQSIRSAGGIVPLTLDGTGAGSIAVDDLLP